MLTPCFAIVGPPASGKTFLITELRNRGYNIIPESAEMVLKSEQAKGNSAPWKDVLAFETKIVDNHLKNLSLVKPLTCNFFDRGDLDVLVYFRQSKMTPPVELMTKIEKNKMNWHKIFVLQKPYSVEESHREDRVDTVPDITDHYNLIVAVYKEYGFGDKLVFIPEDTIDITKRVDWILNKI